MTTLAIASSIDALAERVDDITGIVATYTVTGTASDDGSLAPIPPSLESTPAALVWWRGTSQILPGNEERIVWDVDVNVWAEGSDGGYGYRVLMPFADRFVVAFRSQAALTLGGVVTKCQLSEIGEITPYTINNNRVYLVLPVRFALLNVYHSSDYAS